MACLTPIFNLSEPPYVKQIQQQAFHIYSSILYTHTFANIILGIRDFETVRPTFSKQLPTDVRQQLPTFVRETCQPHFEKLLGPKITSIIGRRFADVSVV